MDPVQGSAESAVQVFKQAVQHVQKPEQPAPAPQVRAADGADQENDGDGNDGRGQIVNARI